MDESREYLDNLCGQTIVNEVFMPIKEKFPNLKEEIEEIEFLFKNCYYNYNRMLEELKRSNAGFDTNMDDKKLLVLNQTKIKEMKVPVTWWADIMVFELQASLFNIARTIDFMVKFNLKNKYNIQDERIPNLTDFLKDRYNGHYFQEELKRANESWIKELKKIRDSITHKYIVKRMQGWLVFTWDRKSEKEIIPGGRVSLGISEYNIEKLDDYLEKRLSNLKDIIIKFFEGLEI